MTDDDFDDLVDPVRSLAARALWADPEYRAKQSAERRARARAQREDPQLRAKHKARTIAAMRDPAVRERHRSAMADPALRERLSAGSKALWTDPEYRSRIAAKKTVTMNTPAFRAKAAARSKAAMADPALRAKVGAGVKARWTDPVYRARGEAVKRNPPIIGECVYCFGPATALDHIIPRSRGGSDDPDNLVAACARCNSSKGAMTPDEWLAAGLYARPRWRDREFDHLQERIAMLTLLLIAAIAPANDGWDDL